jgi:hypothetical protein
VSDFKDLEFPVKVLRDAFSVDDLYLRFRFLESLSQEQKERFGEILGVWNDEVVTDGIIPYVDEDIKWYTRSTLAVVFVDIGGAEEELFEALSTLFKRVKELSPLKEVRLVSW